MQRRAAEERSGKLAARVGPLKHSKLSRETAHDGIELQQNVCALWRLPEDTGTMNSLAYSYVKILKSRLNEIKIPYILYIHYMLYSLNTVLVHLF